MANLESRACRNLSQPAGHSANHFRQPFHPPPGLHHDVVSPGDTFEQVRCKAPNLLHDGGV
eukprot:2315810-Amphidinium_carterae.1